MENEVSVLKIHEIIKKANSSTEPLGVHTDLILEASSELDELIRLQLKQKNL